MENSMNIGLDHIAVYAPNQYLSLEDLAQARNVDPNKYTVGIGIKEMAVASTCEDVVVLAANAGYRVLEESGVSPKDIGLLIVGTESAEDKAKPTATHVHELLGINNSCRVYDIVHACAGATYGVLSAIDWLHHPNHKYALVIASDVARYGKDTPGEPTQGAGAVAMLLSKTPRIMALEEIRAYSKNVYDFWKPMDREFPIVDGVYSAQCYLDAVEQCFSGLSLYKDSYFLFHTPYSKLVQQAHAKVVRMLGDDIDRKQHYEEYVASSNIYPSRIGNIYTGSLWLSLVSLFGNFNNSTKEPTGNVDKITDKCDGCYLFSYGSGCGAVLMRGEFRESCEVMIKKMQLNKILEGRIRLSVEEYEELAYSPMAKTSANPSSGYFKYEGIRDDKRQYTKLVGD
jgi:hydroxymethylglutaryl-CoA synthase